MKHNIQIKVKDLLDKKWENYFEGMKITYDENNTIFYGNVKDTEFLHGVLNRIRDLNLKLISVNIYE